MTIKPELVKSSGSLPFYAGQQAGCEAAISQMFIEEETVALYYF